MYDQDAAKAKLKEAINEIKAVIERHDIAAFVVLHAAPNAGETFLKLSPSYSIVSMEGRKVTIRSKATEYQGDREKQFADQEASANMMAMLAELTGMAALQFGDISAVVDKATGAEHTDLHRTDDH